MHIPRRLLVACCLTMLLAPMIVVPTAHARPGGPYNLGLYETNSQCDTGYLHDPVTAVFWGSGATPGNLGGDHGDLHFHMSDFADWPLQESGYLNGSPGAGYCSPQQAQVETGPGPFQSRYHIRLWRVDGDATNWTVGTPHHEFWDCGTHQIDGGAFDRGAGWKNSHGSGFDLGRRRIYNSYNGAPHHNAEIVTLGNTHSFWQSCEHNFAGSNGKVVYVSVGRQR